MLYSGDTINEIAQIFGIHTELSLIEQKRDKSVHLCCDYIVENHDDGTNMMIIQPERRLEELCLLATEKL